MVTKVLREKDLAIDESIKDHIYDGSGRLLMKKGTLLRTKSQINKLISLNAICRLDDIDMLGPEINGELTPFEQIEGILNYLTYLFEIIVHEPAHPKKKVSDKFFDLSNTIIKLCELDIDAVMGWIHLGQVSDYAAKHPLQCAVFNLVLAKKLGINGRRLNSIICAAITANLGMYQLQHSALLSHQGALTESQRERIDKHAMRSVVLLKRNGILDKLWLEIILQHHEKLDGTGYPRKLKGKRFVVEGRMLGLADRYCAMISSREYREAMTPSDALKRLFRVSGPEVDVKLTSVLIKEIGIYPPGAVVELVNKEIAIVTRRGEDKMIPVVKSIFTADGNRYPEPLERDSRSRTFQIAGLSDLPDAYISDLYALWDYNNLNRNAE